MRGLLVILILCGLFPLQSTVAVECNSLLSSKVVRPSTRDISDVNFLDPSLDYDQVLTLAKGLKPRKLRAFVVSMRARVGGDKIAVENFSKLVQRLLKERMITKRFIRRKLSGSTGWAKYTLDKATGAFRYTLNSDKDGQLRFLVKRLFELPGNEVTFGSKLGQEMLELFQLTRFSPGGPEGMRELAIFRRGILKAFQDGHRVTEQHVKQLKSIVKYLNELDDSVRATEMHAQLGLWRQVLSLQKSKKLSFKVTDELLASLREARFSSDMLRVNDELIAFANTLKYYPVENPRAMMEFQTLMRYFATTSDKKRAALISEWIPYLSKNFRTIGLEYGKGPGKWDPARRVFKRSRRFVARRVGKEVRYGLDATEHSGLKGAKLIDALDDQQYARFYGRFREVRETYERVQFSCAAGKMSAAQRKATRKGYTWIKFVVGGVLATVDAYYNRASRAGKIRKGQGFDVWMKDVTKVIGEDGTMLAYDIGMGFVSSLVAARIMSGGAKGVVGKWLAGAKFGFLLGAIDITGQTLLIRGKWWQQPLAETHEKMGGWRTYFSSPEWFHSYMSTFSAEYRRFGKKKAWELYKKLIDRPDEFQKYLTQLFAYADKNGLSKNLEKVLKERFPSGGVTPATFKSDAELRDHLVDELADALYFRDRGRVASTVSESKLGMIYPAGKIEVDKTLDRFMYYRAYDFMPELGVAAMTGAPVFEGPGDVRKVAPLGLASTWASWQLVFMTLCRKSLTLPYMSRELRLSRVVNIAGRRLDVGNWAAVAFMLWQVKSYFGTQGLIYRNNFVNGASKERGNPFEGISE